MSLDPFVADRLRIAEGLTFADLRADPGLQARLAEASEDDRPFNPPDAEISDELVAGPIGELRLRVYRPDGATGVARPAFVWAHGGGFVSGTLDQREADLVSREVCVRAEAVVVSVDYHLATGTVAYPTLHQEVAHAVRWTRLHAADLGVDTSRITLGGSSAGGNLALAAALELRGAEDALPARLVLAYPMLHRRSMTTPEIEETVSLVPPLFRIEQEAIDLMFGRYLGRQSDAPFASVEGNALAGLPDSLVIVAQYDALRGSGEAFADQARSEGVNVELYVAEGMPHGYLNLTPLTAEVDCSLQTVADFVRQVRVMSSGGSS